MEVKLHVKRNTLCDKLFAYHISVHIFSQKEFYLVYVRKIPVHIILTDNCEQNSRIENSETVLWNGPAGYFENPNFATGSYEIAKAITKKNKNMINISTNSNMTNTVPPNYLLSSTF